MNFFVAIGAQELKHYYLMVELLKRPRTEEAAASVQMEEWKLLTQEEFECYGEPMMQDVAMKLASIRLALFNTVDKVEEIRMKLGEQA
jgi:hypothetical protein